MNCIIIESDVVREKHQNDKYNDYIEAHVYKNKIIFPLDRIGYMDQTHHYLQKGHLDFSPF